MCHPGTHGHPDTSAHHHQQVRELLAEHGIKVSHRTVQRLAASGKLPHVLKTRGGSDYLFDRSEVLLYLAEQARAKAS